MFKKFRIRTKILLAFAVIAVITVATIALIAFSIGQSALEEESFNKLTAVREMKANQIEDYFQLINDQLITQSRDRMIVEAMKEFGDGFDGIDSELPLTVGTDPALGEYYQNEFLERLIPNLLREVTVEEYLPSDDSSKILQDLYISTNPFETGSKHLLDSPDDGSRYSEAHELYHPIIRDFLEHFGYYDIFLVDPEGNIVYSVFKEVDFGTSLNDGPYKDTNFARVYQAALAEDDEHAVMVADFEPYHPSYNAPAAFIASPIFEDEEKIGVLVFQMPIDQINSIMTNNQNWSEVGLGESGETYLVGPDFKLRNQSRFLIEDSENYFQAIDEAGVHLATIGQIRNLNSTIGLQEVDTEGTQAALDGETGTAIFPDYRDVPVLSAYKPLDITGVDWVIMSEIDEAEAFASIQELGLRLLLGSVGLIAFVIIAAVFFSRSLTKPIVDLQEQANLISAGKLDTSIKVETEDEINDLAVALESMRLSNRALIGDLEDINQNLENLVAERTVKLEASERQSNSIIEQSSDAIVVVDGDGIVLVWNARAQQMFGHSREEMQGQPINRIVPEIYDARHQEALEIAKKSGHLKNPGVTHELSGLRDDGSEFPMELAISTWKLDGASFFSASIRDITERKEAEQQLRLQSSALESAANGIVITDISGTIQWVNPAFTDLTGYSFEDAVGSNTSMLRSGEHEDVFYREMWETIKAGQVWSGELINKRKDGTKYPEEMTITPVLDTEGEISRYVAIKQDITERKQAEREIREKEERIRSIVEIAPDAVISIDGEQNITMFNSKAEEVFGYTAEEVLGQPLIMLMPESSHAIHPQEVNDYLNESSAARVMDGRRSIAGRRKDGTIFPAEAGISKLELDGQMIFTAFFRDITERKRLEADIANQLSFIRSLVDTIPSTIFAMDPDQRYILFNKAYEQAYGVEGEALIGSTVMDIENLSLEQKENYYAQNTALLENGGMNHDEIEIRFADGELHTILQWVTSFERSDGSIGGLVGIAADITNQKEMERLLEIANERMSTELNFARDIQISMLPLIFPAFPDRKEVSVHAALDSAREVGGDFYDFYFLDDEHLCFVVGDVSGKGAPGALMMAVSKTLIKSRAADDDEPASILTHVNDELSQDNVSSMFVTVFLGILNVRTGDLVYTNAGHNPPYIRRKDGSIHKVDAFHGPVIGAMPGMPYEQDRDKLQEGDVILVYSDGVTEAFDEEEELFSEARLEDLLSGESLNSDEKIVVGTQEALRQFVGGAEQSDDITLLAVQFLLQPQDMEAKKIHITIKNRYEDMGIVEEQFTEFAEENELSDAVRQTMSIVVDELLNNAISYAYQGEKEKEIEVGFELSGNRLVLTIKDSGVPFNPFSLESPDITESIEERQIGGLGIHMVRNMMDEYNYQRQINKNVVTLVKLIER